jgi:hypothetical protein
MVNAPSSSVGRRRQGQGRRSELRVRAKTTFPPELLLSPVDPTLAHRVSPRGPRHRSVRWPRYLPRRSPARPRPRSLPSADFSGTWPQSASIVDGPQPGDDGIGPPDSAWRSEMPWCGFRSLTSALGVRRRRHLRPTSPSRTVWGVHRPGGFQTRAQWRGVRTRRCGRSGAGSLGWAVSHGRLAARHVQYGSGASAVARLEQWTGTDGRHE